MVDHVEADERDPVEDAHEPRVPLKLEEAICAGSMGLICLISFGNVVVRYLSDYSFAFTEEYSIFLLVVMTFAGSALAFAKGGHIRITYLVGKMPLPLRLMCEAVAILATTIMFALIVYYGGLLAWDEYAFGERSPGLGYPRWIYTVWLPILSVAILLRVAGYAWRTFRTGYSQIRTPGIEND
jgi:TRAP-type C4-dicarboxylate transport system permease small subunit